MTRHSKFLIGSCVATTFGVGVLVARRVEDESHVVQSMWKGRTNSSANAYLNRNALRGVLGTAVGFRVTTKLGKGTILSYFNAAKRFQHGRYSVWIRDNGSRQKGHDLEFERCDILSCQGPAFVPVIENIRETAQYQIQLDNYRVALRLRDRCYQKEEKEEVELL